MIDLPGRNQAKGSLKPNLFFSQEHPSMTLTKDQLIESVRNRLGISKSESSRIVESLLETIKTSLSNGEDSGFGALDFQA